MGAVGRSCWQRSTITCQGQHVVLRRNRGGREAAHYRPGQLLLDLMERALCKSKAGKGGATLWGYSEQARILGHYLRFSERSTSSDALIRDVQCGFRP